MVYASLGKAIEENCPEEYVEQAIQNDPNSLNAVDDVCEINN